MKVLKIGNDELKYKVIIKNNKNTYFRVKDDYVLVTTNKYVSMDLIKSHILENSNRYLKVIKHKQEKLLKANDKVISLWGVTYPLYITNSYHFNYEVNDLGVFVEADDSDIVAIKKEIYLREIKIKVNKFNHLINEVLIKHQISTQDYKYKYLKSKFGSFHKKGKTTYITLNTFLATLEENFLYYVIMHEYAHVKVFDHSHKFWDLLGLMMPNWKIYDKSLKKIVII